MSVGVFDGIEFAGVEFLVEIGSALFGDSIESAMDLFEQSVFGQFTTSATGVLSDWPTLGFDSRRREIPILSDEFEDSIIRGNHPVRLFSHGIGISRCRTHRITDGQYLTTRKLETTYIRQLAINNRQ